jgi:hypothetical protein
MKNFFQKNFETKVFVISILALTLIGILEMVKPEFDIIDLIITAIAGSEIVIIQMLLYKNHNLKNY